MAPPAKVSAIVLAAGLSKRLGRNKLLVPVEGIPAVRRVVLALLQSRAGEVLVVTGHESDRVYPLVRDLAAKIVHNPRYAEGQSTSLKAGLAAADPGAGGFLFALGDQPLITAALVDALIGAFSAAGALAAAPFCAGRRRNPVLFSAALRKELMGVEGDEGARALWRRLEAEDPGALARLEVADERLFWDLDTEGDLHRLSGRPGGP